MIVENEIDEVPTLILKPFTIARVVFENVPIGVCVKRSMNIVNPTQKSLQIFLRKALPQELKINLVEGRLLLDPHDRYTVTLCWTPLKPTTHREIIHFTDQKRGHYDVVIVFKSIVISTPNVGQCGTDLNDTYMTFKPHVCSTAIKGGEMGHKENPSSHICSGLLDNDTCHQGAHGTCKSTVNQFNLGTCNKGDSSIVPLDPQNPNNLQSSPYSTDPQFVDGMQGVTLPGPSKSQPKSLMFEKSKSRRIFNDPNFLIGNVRVSSSTIDPFLLPTYFYDKQSTNRFEQESKRWLNYLLTPPAECETDGVKIDLRKVWIKTKNKEIPAAPTCEQVASQYHSSHRLDSLRKAARNLLMTPQMSQVFVKLGAQIDKQIISMRKDKCLHLDIGLQKLILDILFCYNPLWLRIGLEVIYETVIPLSSNSDMHGLSVFIIQHMFKDHNMFANHQNHKIPNMLQESYTEQMKKFTLKKYFMLVYFLDQAKQKKLICHDPCLFRRNAPSKESRDMLSRFTRELIAGIGDITKHLRPLGYVVTHKQSYLDEYKYAVHNLAVDLKDGIRLTKVMEIILVKDNLTKNLRTPPKSLLHKVHNCKVALQALNDANFKIVGDITPRDIVDGHRQKTLSLLWQILHVFEHHYS